MIPRNLSVVNIERKRSMKGIKTMLAGIIVICYGIIFAIAQFDAASYVVLGGTLIAFIGLFIKDKK